MEIFNLKSLEYFNEELRKHEKRLGITLLDRYQRYDVPMRYKVTNGIYAGLTGKGDYTSIRRMKSVQFTSLTLESKQKHWEQVAFDRGCTILKQDNKFRVNERLVIQDRYGAVVETDFTTLRRSKRNTCNISLGEQLVMSLLEANSIKYVREKCIKNQQGNTQFIDVLAELGGGRKVAIEYNGAQHYKELSWTSKSLKQQQVLDALKKEQCLLNGWEYCEIPYTANSLTTVQPYLARYGVINIPDTPMAVNNIEQQVLHDYCELNLPRKTVAEKYGISELTVSNIAKRHGKTHTPRFPRVEQIQRKEQDIIYDYITLNLPRPLVAEKYSICASTVTSIAQKYGYRKNSAGNVIKVPKK